VTRAQKLLVLALGCLAVAVIGWNVWSHNFQNRRPNRQSGVVGQAGPESLTNDPTASPKPSRIERMLALTEIRTDESGEVVEIVGPDPITVLIAFCDAGAYNLEPEPLEITETVPAFRHARLGLFRDYNALGNLYAIRIHRDWRTRRWVAGNGRGPIQVTEAPELPPDALRVPVRTR
jgi:hypothetical protein